MNNKNTEIKYKNWGDFSQLIVNKVFYFSTRSVNKKYHKKEKVTDYLININ